MVLTIYGEDSYRAKQKVEEMVARFKEKYDPSAMNMDRFSIGEHEVGEIMSAVGAPPFLAERRMVIIVGLALSITKKADAELWAKRLAGRGEETIVILLDTGVTKERATKNKLYLALKETGDLHMFPFGEMTSSEAQGFVGSLIVARSQAWPSNAVQELIVRADGDTWRLVNAFNKVSAAAGTSAVTKALVEQYVEPTFNDKLFAFLDAVREGKQQQAVQLLSNELSRGTAAGQLLMMLEREVQLLVELRAFAMVHGRGSERDAARVLGLHPFIVKKTLSRAMQVEADDLKMMVDAVMKAELRLKRESMGDVDVLKQLVIDLVVT
ncbi:DNA polymerase III subunit delta [Candidatus Uhrbacteria bacterium CG10_big_fil_rev_8_21_14_0_10_50_16]|uniref:DNA polymerase III subunit delta n=1 Tax=Candidatus Uhrbacteria bacterium CG10_big_fil_rev_8_21_14_0_10_50_16 TaxID=1975039 RepID=A0A2H0RNR4_9BACT|nr:MAG: DNA polymerase III subunit delta [Candidatus Uhrbacteria bacterium CG10_big_fil_rev_8_21_14_0_10_50_16]